MYICACVYVDIVLAIYKKNENFMKYSSLYLLSLSLPEKTKQTTTDF